MHLMRISRFVILCSSLIFLLFFAPGVSASSRPNASPAITLSPTVGPPTSMVQVSGTNFGSNEKVDVYFDTTDEVLTSTNSQGMFSTSFQVPAGATPGTHTVSAVGRSSKLNAQAPFLVQTNWAQFRFNSQHTGTNPYENVLNASNVANLKVSWSVMAGYSLNASPTVVNGVVYFDTSSNLYAFNVLTGALLWSASVYSGQGYTPAVANGIVYIGGISQNSSLYAFNAQTGALLWSSYITHGANTSPTVANGKVYIAGSGASSGGEVFAYNATTGAELWETSNETNTRYNSTPAVAGGVVYAGGGAYSGNGGEVDAFNAQTGKKLWSATTDAINASSPSVVNGMVYFGSGSPGGGNVYALNAQTGKQIWSASSGNTSYSSPAVTNGIVYIGSRNKHVYALNAQTGAILWSAPVSKSINSSPTVANGLVYVGSDKMYAFNAQSGVQVWSNSSIGSVNASPVVVNGAVYVGSVNGNVNAFVLPSQDQP